MMETWTENLGGCFGQEIEFRDYQARGSGTTKNHEQKYMTTTTQEMHAFVTAPGLGVVEGAEKPLVVQRRPVPLDALRPLSETVAIQRWKLDCFTIHNLRWLSW